MFCLSRGLSAPVGSLLVGKQEFIRRARRIRKLLGGGMHQAGILAAAGIVALEQMVERLAEDHEHCLLLAQGLAEFPRIEINLEYVKTNILIFSLLTAQGERAGDETVQRFLAKTREHDVLLDAVGEGSIRAVTHYGLERDRRSQLLSIG
jgi:threonine aldolase